MRVKRAGQKVFPEEPRSVSNRAAAPRGLDKPRTKSTADPRTRLTAARASLIDERRCRNRSRQAEHLNRCMIPLGREQLDGDRICLLS
jgi:hypothetical protein